VDKAPSLGVALFFRVIFPGAIVTTLLTPLVLKLMQPFGLTAEQQTAFIGGLLIVIGVVLWALDDPIYGLLEGRWMWPLWLKDIRTRAWRGAIKRMYARAEEAEGGERVELWYVLRQFPVEGTGPDEVPTATRPTRLGNILASYEDYPDRRYGMDAVFYWPRLWMQLDKDTRSEIDDAWAVADALTYLCVGLFAAALMYLAAALWYFLVPLPLIPSSPFTVEEPPRHILAALGLLFLSWRSYALSLPLHVRNGERFRAVFDLHRDKVSGLAPATAEERARFEEINYALEYGLPFKHKPKPAPLSIPPDAEFGVVFKKP
jgi:hypothetical protein